MSTNHSSDFPTVYTPLGSGKIVHKFPDGSLAIELSSGGGVIYRREELMISKRRTPPCPAERSQRLAS
jgi:hypothetical protein